MSKFVVCDICRKKKSQKKQDEWATMSLGRGGFVGKLPGLDSSYVSFDLCNACADTVLPKALALIGRGK